MSQKAGGELMRSASSCGEGLTDDQSRGQTELETDVGEKEEK